ncbi:MAG TPA: transglutaminase-like domain-containing protein [Pararobbsia sp.]|nr:transglutaminase-like domain-containing protein [Pararobbsia sp.]
MDRRSFVQWGAAALAYAGGGLALRAGAETLPGAEQTPASEGWKIYEVTTTVSLPAGAAPARVWLPVTAVEIGDYQRTLSTRFDAPGGIARLARAPGYDVQMVAVDWPAAGEAGVSADAGARVGAEADAGVGRLAGRVPDGSVPGANTQAMTAQLVNVVALREHAVDLSLPPSGRARRESADTVHEYLRPTALLPTDGIVRERAMQITAGMHDDVTRARAIYEWVVDHTCREASVRGCGTGDVVAMLKTGGIMNGKCADINGLFVALARSIGIPARDAYGVRVDASAYGFKAMGKPGDITGGQHCRAEFYTAGYGWIPVDPADVRKVALEEVPGGLPMSDLKVQAARAMLFGKWEMNWVAYNHGHDVALPGSAAAPVPFLMYPNGETSAGVIDSLDAKRFSYRIASKRLA